ncbi:unnamed protein product [Cylindrotheca closterium]|uniref:GPI inositol-deacylase n=1 Tax=Cylindrotheca closterium TaxID=2856 RepID=A0AAD2CSP5_9STRA|nr:unnamed protein product [Cylindrotheca closterium]
MGNLLSGKGNCWEGTSGNKKVTFTDESTSKHIKLLFGCNNAEEHLEYVQEMCDLIADKHGAEGLSGLGLEFRYITDKEEDGNSQTKSDSMPFSSPSAELSLRQKLQEEAKKNQNGEYSIPIQDGGEPDHAPDHVSISDDSNSDDKTDLKKSARFQHAISELSSADSDDSAGDDNNDNDDDVSISDEEKDISYGVREMSIEPSEFFVPLGEPISRMGSDRSLQTATTMFSLSTHESRGSAASKSPDGIATKPSGHLLFHKSSNTQITEKNHQLFIAHGKMYDEVARLCTECAQHVMMKEGNLEWQSLGDGINAMVTRNRSFRRPLLLIVTGKGKVGAGIFSRRHLMTNGIETSTALPFVQRAIHRKMDVAVLDPNGGGGQNAMQCVQTSLERLFLDHGETDEEVYILAHSMAGSQIVRFLHDKTFDKDTVPKTTKGKGVPTIAPSNAQDSHIQTGMNFLQQIKAVAFTDSNHNINWTKHNRPLKDLVEGPSSLYIKSHKVHEDAKILGEKHHDCDFWKHRFGNIKTIWGGTHEHALTNYTGMEHIWEHFDEIMEQSGEDQTSG